MTHETSFILALSGLFVAQFAALLVYMHFLTKDLSKAHVREKETLLNLTTDMVAHVRTHSAEEAANLKHMRRLNDLEAKALEDTWKQKLTGEPSAKKHHAAITTPDGRELEPLGIEDLL